MDAGVDILPNGRGGVPEKKSAQSYFFWTKNPMQNFRTPGQLLLGEKYATWKKKKRKKIIPKIVDTVFLLHRPRAAYALRSDQFLQENIPLNGRTPSWLQSRMKLNSQGISHKPFQSLSFFCHLGQTLGLNGLYFSP